MSEILSPQMLADEAKDAYQREDYPAAARTYLAAAQSFDALNDHLTAAEMRNNASVAWLKANKADAALAAADGTPTVFAEAKDVRREGIAWGNVAAALEAKKRLPEACQAYEKSIELLESCGEREYSAYANKALAALKLRTGQQIEALARMDVGLSDLPELSAPQKLLKRLLALWQRILPH